MAHRPRPLEPIPLCERAPKSGVMPRWLWCDASEFINFWLPKFERHELSRPTAEELATIDKCMLSADRSD